MFDRLADIIVKHPKKIVILWVAILLVSVGVILSTDSNLKYDMTTMEGSGSESVEGMGIIAEEFYSSGQNTAGIIIVAEHGTTDISGLDEELQKKIDNRYGASVVMVSQMFDDPAAGMTIYSLAYPTSMDGSDMVPEIRDMIKSVKSENSLNGVSTYVTGSEAITYDTMTGAMSDVSKIDPISILLILVLIGLFFRSFVASATPPLVVGTAYGIVTCLIYFLGMIMDIFYITPILLLVSMLGAGCDYCIFVMARYKEERKKGEDKEEAIRESVKWAGESITTSGLSVIIGFGVMSFCSFSLVSTMGVVLALGIVIALLAALTLIPSILMIIGDRIFYPSNMEKYADGSKVMNGWYGNWSRRGQRYFTSSAGHAIKYAKPIVLAAVLVTVPLAYITFSEDTSYDMISTMPPGEAKEGVDIIVDTMGGGVMMPTYELIQFDQPLGTIDQFSDPDSMIPGSLTWNSAIIDEYKEMLNGIDESIMSLDNVQFVISLPLFIAAQEIVTMILDGDSESDIMDMIDTVLVSHGFDPSLDSALYNMANQVAMFIKNYNLTGMLGPLYNYLAYEMGLVSEDLTYAKTMVLMKDEPMSAVAMDTIDSLRGLMSAAMAESGGRILNAWTTGSVAATYDISNTVNEEFTWIEIGVVILIFLLLFFVLKSYITPLRAIVTILMSIAWTLGMTHIIFGWVFGMDILWLIPIVLLVVCLGLGMDYDILLTTRIRENRLKGMTNDEAITHAVEKSGAVITICGLIMSGTFSTLMLSSSPMLMQFGFALGFAILVDALIVRTYIVPAIMHLLGDWNWKGPKWLQRGKHSIDFGDKDGSNSTDADK